MANGSGSIPVAIMGLGAIGRQIARAALSSSELSLVAAIDSAPSLRGLPLSELVPGAPDKLRIESDPARALKALRGGVLLHATGSRFSQVYPELEQAARAGVHVVSTCEELAFPWATDAEKADQLDQLAAKSGASILGTGVNPGFVLDRLVAVAGAVCGKVKKVRAQRTVDASSRREALRRKIGVGLSEAEFDRKLEAGELGHVGLLESACLCAEGLGLLWDETDEEARAVLADEKLAGPVKLEPGQVAGIYQRVRLFLEEREVVDLELTIAAGIDDPGDRIELDAEPKVALEVKGGYPGEESTAWAVVNAAPRVAAAEPGLLTVLELPAGR